MSSTRPSPSRRRRAAQGAPRALVAEVGRQLELLDQWAAATGPKIRAGLRDARCMFDRLREAVADVEKARAAARTMRETAAEVAAATGEPDPPEVPDPVGDVAALLDDPYLRALFTITMDGRLDALIRSAMPAGPGR